MTIEEYLEYANKTLKRKRAELESYIKPLSDGLIKVNRVTIDIQTANGNVYRVDKFDLILS